MYHYRKYFHFQSGDSQNNKKMADANPKATRILAPWKQQQKTPQTKFSLLLNF